MPRTERSKQQKLLAKTGEENSGKLTTKKCRRRMHASSSRQAPFS
jgi:hypothetical protein